MSDGKGEKKRVLQVNLRSDFGGGPHHMYQLISTLLPATEVFAAMPKEYPYWDLNVNLLGESKCFELPHRKFKVLVLLKLALFVVKNNITVIHAHGKGAGIYGRLLSFCTWVPCIYTFHGLHYGKYSPFKKKVYFAIERILSWCTSRYICVSQGEAQEVARYLPSVMPKVSVIYGGVLFDSSRKVVPVQKGQQVVITMISRLDYQKNLELVVPVVVALQFSMPELDFILNVVGVPDEENELRKLIREHQLEKRVIFRGFTTDIHQWLSQSHLYLSTSRWEGLPISLLEAMAWGIPCVVSDVTGNRDAIRDNKNGFLYPLEQPEKAAENIIRLVNEPSLYSFISGQARESVRKHFSLTEMTRQTKTLYNEI